MARAAVCAALVALAATAAGASAALPRHGTLVPGGSLGGIRLGQPSGSVLRRLGPAHGVCRGCARPTWYFTYRPFDRHGLAVELDHGRVAGVYTVWSPAGWSAARGIALGMFSGEASALTGTTIPISCDGYQALVADSDRARTVYYVFGGKLWGFGLFARGADPCR
jgi:hypothetical protein